MDLREERAERAERMGLDLGVFQMEDNETPEEKAERIARSMTPPPWLAVRVAVRWWAAAGRAPVPQEKTGWHSAGTPIFL